MLLTTTLMQQTQRAKQLMARNPALALTYRDSQLGGLWQARTGGHLIGASIDLGMLLDLLETAERLSGGGQ